MVMEIWIWMTSLVDMLGLIAVDGECKGIRRWPLFEASPLEGVSTDKRAMPK